MIAGVARESGRNVEVVALESYALTLWSYLQSEESHSLRSLIEEEIRIEFADMLTRGYIGGTKEIDRSRRAFQARLVGRNGVKTREDIQAAAIELMERHERQKLAATPALDQ